MITLNLLPPSQKSAVRLLRILQFAKSCLSLLLFMTIVGGVILFTALFALEVDFYPVVSGTSLMQKETEDFSGQVRRLNMALGAIKAIQEEGIEWSSIILQFTQTIPEGIQIVSLSLDKTSQAVHIRGKGKTREDVLQFQENLENCPLLSNITGPLSNILYPENVDFQFDAKLNL